MNPQCLTFSTDDGRAHRFVLGAETYCRDYVGTTPAALADIPGLLRPADAVTVAPQTGREKLIRPQRRS